jgi:hypothetical protein
LSAASASSCACRVTRVTTYSAHLHTSHDSGSRMQRPSHHCYSAGRRPVTTSRPSPPRAFTPCSHSPVPVPLALHTEAQRTSILLFLICSRCRFAAEVAAGELRLSLIDHRREHLPHSLSSFEQDPTTWSHPTAGSKSFFHRRRSLSMSPPCAAPLIVLLGDLAPSHPSCLLSSLGAEETIASPESRPLSPPKRPPR